MDPNDLQLLNAALLNKKDQAIQSLKRGANVNCRDGKEGVTALMLAARHGHLDMIELLVSRGADVNALSFDGDKTCLLTATFSGHYVIASRLITLGADVNGKNQRGDTPLLIAAHLGRTDLVQLFLSKGANLDAQSIRNGYSPLLMAMTSGHDETAVELISNGANVNIVDKLGVNALIIAVTHCKVDIATLLLSAKADISLRYKGKTPLLQAIAGNCMPCVRVLVNAGANVLEADTVSGLSAISLATKLKLPNILQILLSADMIVNSRSNSACNNADGSVNGVCVSPGTLVNHDFDPDKSANRDSKSKILDELEKSLKLSEEIGSNECTTLLKRLLK